MRTKGAGTLVLAVIALTIASCTSTPTTPPDAAPSPTVALASPQDGDGDVGLEPEASPTPLDLAQWNDDARAAVVTAADDVAAAFLRADLTTEDWLTTLEPLVTTDLLGAWANIDPATIPVGEVTGTGSLDSEPTTPFLATVRVPTSTGDLLVTMTRLEATDPWLAAVIAPPSPA